MRAEPIYRWRRNRFRQAVRRCHRMLLTESLERRDLLAAVSIENIWRSDDFGAAGSFSYLYTETNPNYVDRIPSGTVQITDGHIAFTSPTEGQWDVSARVEGNGTTTVNGQLCASYRAIHSGTMSGDYNNGLLKGSASSPTSSSYPSHTGPCPKPDNPTDYSPFTSDLATLLSGTYDETNDLAGFNWSGPYAGGTIAVTIPPTAIQYQNTSPTDLVVTAKTSEAGLEVTGKVVGRHLKPGPGGRAEAVTDVQLFFTSAPNPQTIVGNVSLDKPIEIFWNTLEATATVSKIDNIPQTARYIMVQIDREDAVAENVSNNFQFIPLNDIQLLSFEGGNPAQGRAAHQLALKYKIERPTNDPNDDKPFEVQIVGASSASAAGLQSLLYSFTVSPSTLSGSAVSLLNEPADNALRAGTHTLIINTSSLNLASGFADHDHKFIVAVADRDDEVFEVDNQPIEEDNLVTFSGFIQDRSGDVAVLRTASHSDDEVVITQPGPVHVDWKGRSSIGFVQPSKLVVITSGGDDSLTTDETGPPVTAMLHLYGDEGDDTIVGGTGRDRLEGNAGDDVVIGGDGQDDLFGGPGKGDDVLLGDGYELTGATLEDLTDALEGYLSSNLLSFTFQLVPSPGAADTIEAGDGASLIMGGTGGDTITGGTGLSLIFGGALQTASGSANFDITSAETSFIEAIKALSSMIDGVELVDSGQNTITGGSGPNLVVGGSSPDIITGGNGSIDILIGNESHDTIDGKDGFNLIIGGGDSDELTGGKGGNLIFGDEVKLSGLNIDVRALLEFNLLKVISKPSFELSGNGDDHINGGSGFDFLVGGDGKDTIKGGEGINVAFGDEVRLQVGGALGVLMDFAALATQISSVPLGNAASVTSAFNSLYGLWEALWDKLSGEEEDRRDDYFGGSDTDIVFGGGGDDFLVGGDGFDFLVGGFGDDEFKANPDQPIVADNLINDFSFGGLGNDTFHGGPGNDFLASTFGADTFYGNGGDDVILAGDGADVAFGGAGNDLLVGGQGSDALIGGPGTDTVQDPSGTNFIVPEDAIIVTTLADEADGGDGEMSLREAIALANASPGTDAIVFADTLTSDVTLGAPAWIVLSLGVLPEIVEPLVILGPGASLLGLDGAGLTTAFPAAAGVAVSVRGLLLTNFDLGSDFGDAPTADQSGLANSYPTLPADNGAEHKIGAWYLGASVDAEVEGLPDAQAGQGTSGGDDHDGQADEDGVSVLATPLSLADASTTSSFLVWASLPGKLDVWIDFDRNGQFDHPTELRTGGSLDVAAGPNIISFPISAGMTAGDTFARFRITGSGGSAPSGPSDVGEVEDIVVRLEPSGGETAIQLPPAELGPNELLNIGGLTLLRDSYGRAWFGAPPSAAAQLNIVGTNASDTLRLGTSLGGSLWQGEFGAGDDVVELSVLQFGRINGADGRDAVRLVGEGLQLDLTTLPSGALQSIETIDLDGQQSQVTLNPAAIAAISDGSNRLEVIAPRVDTRLNIGPGWKLSPGILTDGGFRHEATKDEATLWIANLLPWQNPLKQWDVSRDDAISPIDALLLVNTLNTELSRRLADPAISGVLPTFYYDVNGDGSVSPIDALFVINYLNANVNGEGELVAPSAEESKRSTVSSVDFSQLAPGVAWARCWGRAESQRTERLDEHGDSSPSFLLPASASDKRQTAELATRQSLKSASPLRASAGGLEGELEELVELLAMEPFGRQWRQ